MLSQTIQNFILVLTNMSENGSKFKNTFWGHNGFDQLRKYIKSGGEFCKELAIVMHNRAQIEASYAKALHKLSSKLVKANKDELGSVSEAWMAVANEMEQQGHIHRLLSSSLSDDVVRPLRQLVETHQKIRKGVEGMVDKTTKNVQEWRTAESKAKKTSYHNTRENEKVQDMYQDATAGGRAKSFTDKEIFKLEKQKKKAEESVKKSDSEYYHFCVRAERARQEWESAVYKGSNCFQTLEEERLSSLKKLVAAYAKLSNESAPKLVTAASKLESPVQNCNVEKDIEEIVKMKSTGTNQPEQLLPDFYCEDVSNAMHERRRREALQTFIRMIRSDLEREYKSKEGVENVSKAMRESPKNINTNSQQDVNERLESMKAMLAYLDVTRHKIQCRLDEMLDRPTPNHPLQNHVVTNRDKQNCNVTVLKVPLATDNSHALDFYDDKNKPDWHDHLNDHVNDDDRGHADGDSVQPDSDFDEFSSQGSDDVQNLHDFEFIDGECDTDVKTSNSEPKLRNYHKKTDGDDNDVSQRSFDLSPGKTRRKKPESSQKESAVTRSESNRIIQEDSLKFNLNSGETRLKNEEVNSLKLNPARRDYSNILYSKNRHRSALSDTSSETNLNIKEIVRNKENSDVWKLDKKSEVWKLENSRENDVADGSYFARPMQLVIGHCKALYDYDANVYDELSIRAGDILKIHEKQPDGWWVGELDGNSGIFPATYVQEID